MLGRFPLRFGLGLTILLFATTVARPQSPDQDAGVRLADTPPTFDRVRIAAARVRKSSCRTPVCRSMLVFDELRTLYEYVVFNADMTGADRILYSPDLVWRRYRRALLDHPELYAPTCHLASAMLVQVSSDRFESEMPVLMLTSAVDIDMRANGGCVAEMVGALPRAPLDDQIRKDAAKDCGWPFHRHPLAHAACAKLLEGLPPAPDTSDH